MNVAIYARVSTTDQSCATQLHELREYVARRNWTVAAEFVDTGWSGAKVSRPELDRLMSAARVRKFDAVIVWKLDRWGRSVAHLVETLQQLSSNGVRFIAVTQNVDTDESNPMSRLLMHLLSAFAEFERELIVERVKAGVARAKREGKHCGRSRIIVDRAKVRTLADQGLTVRQIADKLGVSPMTACRALKAPSAQVRS